LLKFFCVARKFNFGVVEKSHLKHFLELFAFNPEKHAPDLTEWMFWVSAMPLFHRWSGNARAVGAIIGRLIGQPVEIIENVEAWFELPGDCRSSLGTASGALGETLVAGRRFADCDSSYQVIVHDLPAARVPEFLPGGGGRRKIEWLLSVCMPGNLEAIISVRTRRSNQPLGKEQRTCYLGYTTYA